MNTFKTISKILTIITFSLLIFSCSDDDSVTNMPEPMPTAMPFVTKVVATGSSAPLNKTFSMIYNSKKQLSQLSVFGTENNAYAFSYNDQGKITEIAVNGSTPGKITLTYDSNGRLSSYKKVDGTNVPVTYNASSEVYTAGVEFFSFNGFEDFTAINGSPLSYDNSKNGAFANANGNYQFLAILIDPLLVYLGSKKPVNDFMATTNLDYVFTNTFSEDQMIKNMKISIVEDPATGFNADFTYENK